MSIRKKTLSRQSKKLDANGLRTVPPATVKTAKPTRTDGLTVLTNGLIKNKENDKFQFKIYIFKFM